MKNAISGMKPRSQHRSQSRIDSAACIDGNGNANVKDDSTPRDRPVSSTFIPTNRDSGKETGEPAVASHRGSFTSKKPNPAAGGGNAKGGMILPSNLPAIESGDKQWHLSFCRIVKSDVNRFALT